MTDEEVLSGGIAHVGAVVRSGAHVLRPSSPNSVTIHETLSALRSTGFDGVPEPFGLDDDGRERLEFIEGDVAIPPYPKWARSDETLVEMTMLIKRLHDASAGIDLTSGTWNDVAADPAGGAVLCHNDVCLENVVFRDGRAVALLDFEFAAPGRPVFDLGLFARMSVPIDDPADAQRLGWTKTDLPRRLRLIADTYGLDDDNRAVLLEIVDHSLDQHDRLVRSGVAAGQPGFVTMWEAMGGERRFERRRTWWTAQRSTFDAALR